MHRSSVHHVHRYSFTNNESEEYRRDTEAMIERAEPDHESSHAQKGLTRIFGKIPPLLFIRFVRRILRICRGVRYHLRARFRHHSHGTIALIGITYKWTKQTAIRFYSQRLLICNITAYLIWRSHSFFWICLIQTVHRNVWPAFRSPNLVSWQNHSQAAIFVRKVVTLGATIPGVMSESQRLQQSIIYKRHKPLYDLKHRQYTGCA